MGQGLQCCQCCWYNSCGVCAGWGCSFFCFGCWLCMPAQLAGLRGQDCCRCGGCHGYGSNFFCTGQFCCIADWMRLYSFRRTIDQFRGPCADIVIMDNGALGPGIQGKLVIQTNYQQVNEMSVRSNLQKV